MEKKVCLKCGSEENIDPAEYVNCPIRDIMEKNNWFFIVLFGKIFIMKIKTILDGFE